MLMLAASVFCASRWPGALPYVFGTFLATKQYAVFVLPLLLMLVDFRVFFRSVVVFHFQQPFRVDSMSYLAWWVRRGHPQSSVLWGFVAAAVATVVALWRAPRTPAGFAASAALVSTAFFAFNKQAFANCYYFVVGGLCAAAAAAELPTAALWSDPASETRTVSPPRSC